LNLVTAHNDRSAQNFGLERHYEYDLRYEMSDEWSRGPLNAPPGPQRRPVISQLGSSRTSHDLDRLKATARPVRSPG
jgi:alkanesulfonate monooxygenase SsuD/methylene tetrahydromethanopterin reductase-like flavin-dependent oxidoreductase (luciferase family)